MAITFDKSQNTIEISIDVSSVTIQGLIDAIRDWEDSAEGIVVKSIANAYGKQDIGGGAKVGITLELINNWRVHFADRAAWTNCYVRGGNIVAINSYNNDPIKSANYVNTIIAQSSSPTLIESSSTWTEGEKNTVLTNTNTVKQVGLGRWKVDVDTKQMVCYDDGGNEIVRFNLFNRFGDPAVDDIFERVPV